jgi:predicted amidohydrolase
MFEVSDDPARPYNTLAVVDRDGLQASYRKIHLYDSFGYRESDVLAPGPVTPLTFDLGGTTVGLMTCYDLRFPELARRLVDAGAEVILLPAAWVAGPRKVDHWTTLLRARAIENTTYVVGVGQPGPRYTGHSMVVGPLGDVLVEAGDGPDTLRADLDPAAVAEARRTNPSLANRRL